MGCGGFCLWKLFHNCLSAFVLFFLSSFWCRDSEVILLQSGELFIRPGSRKRDNWYVSNSKVFSKQLNIICTTQNPVYKSSHASASTSTSAAAYKGWVQGKLTTWSQYDYKDLQYWQNLVCTRWKSVYRFSYEMFFIGLVCELRVYRFSYVLIWIARGWLVNCCPCGFHDFCLDAR